MAAMALLLADGQGLADCLARAVGLGHLTTAQYIALTEVNLVQPQERRDVEDGEGGGHNGHPPYSGGDVEAATLPFAE
ncbi:hypothetical protein ACFC6U_05600 [Kitasatospora purpeofusca]|uniref:hypothetical protein n=1 Tax=Kitasatospora purpeofusca TaxID=67352 RepID=UPI0035D5FE62